MGTAKRIAAKIFPRRLAFSCAVLVGFHAALLSKFNTEQPRPYMDEEFHVRQTATYCRGDFFTWDPKITTFPGLYLIAAALAPLMREAAVIAGALSTPSLEDDCVAVNLRVLNTALGIFIPPLLYDILRQLNPQASVQSLAINALVISSLPTCFFFHFLYYTDTAATLAILVVVALAQRGFYCMSALPATVAIGIRQTNAVWVAFVLMVNVMHCERGETQHETLLDEVMRSASSMLGGWRRILRNFTPLALVVAAFGAFVITNKGVVVGDRENHKPALHFAQLLYFSAFTAVNGNARRCASFVMRAPFAIARLVRELRLLTMFTLMTGVVLAIHNGTLCHPFLLADNRHYTFYLWKDLLRKPLIRFGAAPGYMLCIGHLNSELSDRPLLWRWCFLACTAAVLVPSPLIEFRYFTVAHMILRLHSPLLRSPREWVPQLLMSALVNACTIGLFLRHQWLWPDGSVARFMW
mmetsp:Transcript_27764/g.61263  ORF Transcript_27764/g.61263 Transcript_27764/m.61263 type:complete len:468 (-) Transcript_27764:61-1464(-)